MMKKGYLKLAFLLLLAVILALLVVGLWISDHNHYRYKLVTPYQISTAQGLELIWQLDGIHTAGFRSKKSYMMVKNGKLFFQGSINQGDPTQITVLNASDGSFIANSKPTSNDAQFTTDGEALYIGIGHKGEIYKYDYFDRKQIWITQLGDVIGPCCFNIIDGELQMSWQKDRYYQVSLDNGSINSDYAKSRVFRHEDGIFYEGAGNVLMARMMDNTILWRARVGSQIEQQPVFRNDKIFFNNNSTPQGVVYAIDQFSGTILWITEDLAVSNVAVSDQRIYFLTIGGDLVGVGQNSGKKEITVKFISDGEFHNYEKYRNTNTDYQVAYDDVTKTVFLLLGDSGQLLAFEETR